MPLVIFLPIVVIMVFAIFVVPMPVMPVLHAKTVLVRLVRHADRVGKDMEVVVPVHAADDKLLEGVAMVATRRFRVEVR